MSLSLLWKIRKVYNFFIYFYFNNIGENKFANKYLKEGLVFRKTFRDSQKELLIKEFNNKHTQLTNFYRYYNMSKNIDSTLTEIYKNNKQESLINYTEPEIISKNRKNIFYDTPLIMEDNKIIENNTTEVSNEDYILDKAYLQKIKRVICDQTNSFCQMNELGVVDEEVMRDEFTKKTMKNDTSNRSKIINMAKNINKSSKSSKSIKQLWNMKGSSVAVNKGSLGNGSSKDNNIGNKKINSRDSSKIKVNSKERSKENKKIKINKIEEDEELNFEDEIRNLNHSNYNFILTIIYHSFIIHLTILLRIEQQC